MRAGQLRHTIAIQEPTETKDSMLGATVSWSTVSGMGAIPAAVWPLRSKERLDAQKLELQTTRKIMIRYRPGINASMRIYWSDKGKIFNIISMTNLDERNRVIEFLATEEV